LLHRLALPPERCKSLQQSSQPSKTQPTTSRQGAKPAAPSPLLETGQPSTNDVVGRVFGCSLGNVVSTPLNHDDGALVPKYRKGPRDLSRVPRKLRCAEIKKHTVELRARVFCAAPIKNERDGYDTATVAQLLPLSIARILEEYGKDILVVLLRKGHVKGGWRKVEMGNTLLVEEFGGGSRWKLCRRFEKGSGCLWRCGYRE